jgi:serine/threonine-protein kinase
MQPGATVNERYEILAELGRGGMGVVYRARNLRLGRDVAIKLFTAPVNHETNSRSQREAQVLAGLSHPNLVKVHSLEKNDEGKLMLVFDYVPGEPLSQLLRASGPLSLPQAGELFQQLCAGLAALHEHKIVHRDIKPSNLLISGTADGGKHLTIIDFGLAKSTQSQKLTATGMVIGTPSYMSPEQFSSSDVSAASDLYSAACVLFEMICGKPPFENESPYLVASAHLSGTIPELPADFAHAASLNGFFETALAKDPSKRFENADEMWKAFAAAETGQANVKVGSGGGSKAKSKAAAEKRSSKAATQVVVRLFALCALAAIGYLCWLNFVPHDNTAEVDAVAATQLREIQQKTWDFKPHDYPGAVNNTRELIERLKRLGPGGLETARVYAFYGRVLVDNESPLPRNPDEAIRVLKKAVEIIRERGGTVEKNDTLFDLAAAYNAAGDWKDSLECMREIAKSSGRRPADLPKAYAARFSHVLGTNGLFPEVLQEFGSLAATTVAKDQSEMNEVRRDVAAALIWSGDYKQAIGILSLNHYEPGDSAGPLHDARNHAMAYAFLRDPVKSRERIAAMRKRYENSETADAKDFYDAVEALNLALENKYDKARPIIVRIASQNRIQNPRTLAARDGLRLHLWNCWLCLKAAQIGRDAELSLVAAHNLSETQNQLDIQHCIVRDGCYHVI